MNRGSKFSPTEDGNPAAADRQARERTESHSEGVALSVIVPVRNDPENLQQCLQALAASTYSNYEVIVVDDASTDDTTEIAGRFRVRQIRLEDRQGPAAARNRAAEAARHEHLFFLDADVAVRPETLGLVAARFLEAPRVDAFFGSYDSAPGAPNLVSQYRNLLHHYVHQIGNEEASTFWSGCGAIRKSVFLEIGGFDADYGRPSIEDIELGARLRESGHRIALVKSIQVKHLKRWTILDMIDCDVRKRGIPWTRLILRQGGIPNDLNLRHGQRLSVALAGISVAMLGLAALDAQRLATWLGLAAASVVAIVLLNLPFYRLVFSLKGSPFAVAVIPLHILYFLCSGIAFGIGLIQHVASRLGRAPAEPT